MANDLLDKLKVKKTPQLFKNVDILIPQPKTKEGVVISAVVVDKTNANIINREDFLGKIKNNLTTQPVLKSNNNNVQENNEKENIKNVSKPTTIDDIQEKNNAIVVDDQVVDAEIDAEVASTSLKTKQLVVIRKLNQKIKLVQISDDSTTISKTKRQTTKPIGVITEGPASKLKIGDEIIQKRINTTKEPGIMASSYYLNNREKFISFITSLYSRYKNDDNTSSTPTCERDDDMPFSLMGHQKIVRDYISQYSPYRGILLFHGLGSGKTCSSIAIAEGLKTNRQVIVMTPASLRTNYVEELKKCGDDLYKKNQFWEFIDTTMNPELIRPLSNVLSISVEFINNQGGAWLMNVTKKPNFENLRSQQQKSLDKQLDMMISYKYKFINYNGMRKSNLNTLSQGNKINPFDNKVVIIDEAHNFVSRIVNKLGRDDTLSGNLYNYLLTAENVRIVLLTGTPIINYPNEIAIMFNILRGLIKTWTFKLTVENKGDVTQKFIEDIFKGKSKSSAITDYIEYIPTSTTLIITRNPFGFVNTNKANAHNGVKQGERGEITDKEFVQLVVNKLKKESIIVKPDGVSVNLYKALPDKLDDFKSYFIDANNNVKNMNLFKRRILGLSSYFRDITSLMPRYDKGKNFHIVRVEMSDYQLGVYESARKNERTLEKNNAKKKKKKTTGTELFDDSVSTYRIFSRSFCNFVFPPEIERPLPGNAKDIEVAILNEKTDEDDLDGLTKEEKLNNTEGEYDADDTDEVEDNDKIINHNKKIINALEKLDANKNKYFSKEALKTYSPKFLNILENIMEPEHQGLHLIYSQFRTLEGIGIMKLMFETNGFVQFKITQKGGIWKLDIAEEDRGKQMFALYTGTETREEKEIIRNVFNGTWKYIPSSLETELDKISSNNLNGEIIKFLMITASGAEGISLKNVRYVHITEPYWHPVRTQQVIGRARRICSHQDLDEELKTVDVFLYLMTLSKEQATSDQILELRKHDKSKLDNKTPITSDEALYEIASLKEDVTNKILDAVKEASIDCTLHSKSGDNEQLKCFTFSSNDPSKYSYIPSYVNEDSDNIAKQNKRNEKLKAIKIEIDSIKYAWNKETNILYDYESFIRENPVAIAKLIISGEGKNATYQKIPI